jgi:hypothetical protein
MRRSWYGLVMIVSLSAWAVPARAQVHLGPQLSVGTDSGFGFGARVVFPLKADVFGMDGAIDGNYFLGGGTGVESWIDANVNVRLPIPIARDLSTRLGGGVNAAFITQESNAPPGTIDSEFGLNLLGHVGWPAGWLRPFAETRFVFVGARQLVLTAGVTFGSAH